MSQQTPQGKRSKDAEPVRVALRVVEILGVAAGVIGLILSVVLFNESERNSSARVELVAEAQLGVATRDDTADPPVINLHSLVWVQLLTNTGRTSTEVLSLVTSAYSPPQDIYAMQVDMCEGKGHAALEPGETKPFVFVLDYKNDMRVGQSALLTSSATGWQDLVRARVRAEHNTVPARLDAYWPDVMDIIGACSPETADLLLTMEEQGISQEIVPAE